MAGGPRGQIITDLGLCVLNLHHLSMKKRGGGLGLLFLQLKLEGPHKEQTQQEREGDWGGVCGGNR